MEIYLNDIRNGVDGTNIFFFSYVNERKKNIIYMNVSATRIRNKRKRPFYTLLLLIWLHCKRKTILLGTIDIDLMWSMTRKYLNY